MAPDTNITMEAKQIEYQEFGVITPVCDGIKYNAADPLTEQERLLCEAIDNLLGDKKLYNRYIEKSLIRAADFDVSLIGRQYMELLLDKK